MARRLVGIDPHIDADEIREECGETVPYWQTWLPEIDAALFPELTALIEAAVEYEKQEDGAALAKARRNVLLAALAFARSIRDQ